MPEGTAPFIFGDDTFSTWYKLVGELPSSKRPLVVLHGGPGLTHDYLIPLADLAAAGRPVVLYDQLGNGRSSKAADKPGGFWTIDLMVAELANLLHHLGIADDFDLLGHSWGGMLGLEFALRRAPSGLRNLVLSNSLARMAAWRASRAAQAKAFPQDVQEGWAAGWADIPRLRAASRVTTAVHGCRLDPQPAEYRYSLDQSLDDPRVCLAFFAGELKDWDIVDQLHKIAVPCLVINGRYDPAQDFVVAPLFHRIPRTKWVRFEESSHTPFWEERAQYMALVGDFLDG